MKGWDDGFPADRRPGPPAGVRFSDPRAAVDGNRLRRLTAIPVPPFVRLLAIAVAPAVSLLLVWSMGGDASKPREAPPAASPATVHAPEPVEEVSDPDRRSYAIALPALRGLPEDAPPGTKLELWVTWDPEVKPKAQIQRLLDDVVLVRIVPPLTPEAPAAAVVSVPAGSVGDLLWGDLYGRFAATVIG